MLFNHHQRLSVIFAAALLGFSTLTSSESVAQDNVVSVDDIEFAADRVIYDPEKGEYSALGNVELRKDGFSLIAGEISYNEKTGVVEAFGAVILTNPEGHQLIAPRITVSNSLRDAFIEDVRLLLADGGQIAGLDAVRDAEKGLTTLNRAVYSPCEVCEGDPNDVPLWQIKAVKVIHDQNAKRLIYENAYLEVMGLPVMWLPFFSHPDPSVERANGLLPIEIYQLPEMGLVLGLPYYHTFGQNIDMTIKPIINTKENPVLAAEFRHHLGRGQYDINASITYTDERDALNLVTGRNEFRGHFFSKGNYTHSDKWRSSYHINWASDDTYLRRYGFSYEDSLTSDYTLEGFYGRSYISAKTLAFDGLRIEDIRGLTGFAIPLIDAEYIPKYKLFGGTFTAKANALALHRFSGLDTRRLSASAEWQRHMVFTNGFVVEAEALLRGDVYNTDDADRPDDPAFGGTNGTEARALSHVSANMSYPMIKYGTDSSQMLEPILEMVLAPNVSTSNIISNEDSRAFELNDLNIFSSDRTSGLDLWESGSRLTYGLRYQFEGKDINVSLLAGQSWRRNIRNDLFVPGTGLEDHYSDFVGRFKISYKDWLDISQRFRLDQKTLSFNRNEINATIGPPKVRLHIGYLQLNRQLNFINQEDREEIRADFFYKLNEEWNFQGSAIEDLTNGIKGVEYGFGLNYIDECFEFSIQFKERYTKDRDIEPGSSIMFRFKLISLGS